MTIDSKKKVLVSICSKNPSFDYLSRNIDYFMNLLKKCTYSICIIDSNSDILKNYQKIKKKYPQVIIHYPKNKHYEYGAYKYSFLKYPNYDIYICIQDTLLFNQDINLDIVNDDQAYIFKCSSSFRLVPKCIPFSKKVLRKSPFKYLNYCQNKKDQTFTLAQHCSFIISNSTISDLFRVYTCPPKNKRGSCAYERLFGLYFIFRNIKTYDLAERGVKKIHGKRK